MLTLLLLAQLAAPAPTRLELANGLRVWIQEDHSRPVALVHVTYHAGSLNEGPGITGIAHYVEHMVYRATENIRNEDAYGYIDRIGGRYTGGTWPDVTRYAETVPSWAVESALRVTAERMTRALFDSLEFERERSNVVTEAHGFAETDAASRLRDAVMMTAFALHPYRYSSNTWARDNLRLTRAQAYAWYREHYGPNNAVLVVAGDVDTDHVRRLVEKHFASLARAPGNGRIDIVEPAQRAEKRITMTEPSDSARLEIVYHVPSARHPDFPAYARFDEIFGGSLRQAAMRIDSSVRVKVSDTATAYPYVYRISAAASPAVDMRVVLNAIDSAIGESLSIEALRGRADVRLYANVHDGPMPAPPSAAPPRQSTLTRTAEALAARELPPWEVSGALRDSIAARTYRATAHEYHGFVREWLTPANRTIGILQPALPRTAMTDSGETPLDVPALTVLPATRGRPEPVPAKALQPLAPIAVERADRVLRNGIRLRSARVVADELLIRVVADFGAVADTLVWSFDRDTTAAAMAAIRRQLDARLSEGTRETKDSSVEGRARARVITAVRPRTGRSRGAALRVAIVGRYPPSEMLDLVAQHVAAFPNRPDVPRNELVAVDTQLAMSSAAGRQVEVVAGLPGVHRNHADRRALELLNYVVGAPYYGGRLGWALTKTGLTYSSAAQSYFDESGHILFSTTADTRNTPATIQAIREVVAAVGERGIEQWELDEAKAFTLGRTLLYGAREHSPPSAIAAALTDSDAAALDLLDLPALSRAYLSVTLADVNRVARAYYRADRLKVVAMGAIPTAEMKSPFAPGTFRALFEPR